MIWIIASLPFWIVGIVTTTIACIGLWLSIRDGSDHAGEDYTAFAILMMLAGVSTSLAAWMGS